MIANDARQIGALVRQARRRAGMSQEQLAFLVGGSRQWVVSFEAGSSKSLDLAIKAIQAVGLAIDIVESDPDPFAEVFGD